MGDAGGGAENWAVFTILHCVLSLVAPDAAPASPGRGVPRISHALFTSPGVQVPS